MTRHAIPLTPGVHLGVSDAEYHADPAERPSLTSTLARLCINQSPLHAWTAHPMLNPNWEPTEKKTFDIGRAAHTAILGRGSGWAVYPADTLGANGAASTKAAKEWAAEQREAGLTPIKSGEEAQVLSMELVARAALDEYGITFDPQRSEVVAIAEIDGVLCRVMIDNAPEDTALPLYDFKTCEDASPEACMRSVMRYGYDVQAQYYREVWRAATGEDRRFRFVFQEKSAPHEVCVIELSDDLAMAEKKTRRARTVWNNSLTSGHWPGYPRGIQRLSLPGWFHERWLERESMEGDFRRAHGHDILDQSRRWQSPVAAE